MAATPRYDIVWRPPDAIAAKERTRSAIDVDAIGR